MRWYKVREEIVVFFFFFESGFIECVVVVKGSIVDRLIMGFRKLFGVRFF